MIMGKKKTNLADSVVVVIVGNYVDRGGGGIVLSGLSFVFRHGLPFLFFLFVFEFLFLFITLAAHSNPPVDLA
jgi:hypothetical protein